MFKRGYKTFTGEWGHLTHTCVLTVPIRTHCYMTCIQHITCSHCIYTVHDTHQQCALRIVHPAAHWGPLGTSVFGILVTFHPCLPCCTRPGAAPSERSYLARWRASKYCFQLFPQSTYIQRLRTRVFFHCRMLGRI